MDESTEHFNLSWTIQATQRARTSSTTSSRKRQEKKVCPWIIRPSPCKYFCGSLIFRLMLCCIYGKSVMWKFDLLLSRFTKQAAGRCVMNFFFLSFIVVVDNEVWIWLLSTPTRWSLNYSSDRALIWLESLSARCRGCRAAMGTRCRSTSNRSLLILFFFLMIFWNLHSTQRSLEVIFANWIHDTAEFYFSFFPLNFIHTRGASYLQTAEKNTPRRESSKKILKIKPFSHRTSGDIANK